MKKKYSQFNNRIFFYTILLVTAYGVFTLIKSFIPTIALGILFSILIFPFFKSLRSKYKLSDGKALMITITTSILLIIIPFVLIISLLFAEVNRFSNNVDLDNLQQNLSMDYVIDKGNTFLESVPLIDYTLTEERVLQDIQSVAKPVSNALINTILKLGSSSGAIITNIIVFILLITAIIPSTPKLKIMLKDLSPLDDEIDDTYLNRSITMIKDMMNGTLLIALVQGTVAGLVLWILGVDYILTLTLVMIILSIIPILGTTIVTIPISIYMMINGDIISGIILLLIQIIIISNIDNYMRPRLVTDKNVLHPVLLLLGVFGGMQVFGLLGFIYGPLVMILFMTSLEIYSKYYKTD